MANDEVTIQILREIRDQITQTNARLDDVRGSVEGVREDLGTLAHRVTEGELRTGTAINDMVSTNREIGTLLRTRFDLRDRVERCEREIEELKRRAG